MENEEQTTKSWRASSKFPDSFTRYLLYILAVVLIIASVVVSYLLIKDKLLQQLTNSNTNITRREKMPLLKNAKIIIRKRKRVLELYSDDKLFRAYKISLGNNPTKDKTVEGDGSTPVGEFYIYTKNEQSKFYLSLALSYPNKEDAVRGLRVGLITQEEHDAIITAINEKKMPPQKTRLGGEIYIHGGTVGEPTDWTQGCIALTNKEIEELFDSVPLETPVVIKP